MIETLKRSKQEREKIANIVAEKYVQDGDRDVFFPDDRSSSRELLVRRTNRFRPLQMSFSGEFTGSLDNTIDLSESVLEDILKESGGKKAAAINQLRAAIDKIIEADTQEVCCMAALGYKRWTPPQFVREWTPLNAEDLAAAKQRTYPWKVKFGWEISNAVFTCTLFVCEESLDSKYKDCDIQNIVVFWTVYIRDVRPDYNTSDFLQPFKIRKISYAAAEIDLDQIVSEVKQQIVDKYFSEDYPPVPPSHRCRFVWAGRMLPGYQVEGENELCE